MALEPGQTFDAPPLPVNYLPAAVEILRAPDGAKGGKGRSLFPLDRQEGPQESLDLSYVSCDLIRNPEGLCKLVGGRGPVAFGPPVDHDGDPRAESVGFPMSNPGEEKREIPSLVIVDAGIAFWNRRFRGPDGWPLFHDVGFFEIGRAGQARVDLLGGNRVRDLCDRAGQPGGQEAVVRQLAYEFPGSFYGLGPDLDGLWHGTAIADLAARDQSGAPAERRLFGLELPASVLLDWAGDSLQHFLKLILDLALIITRDFASHPTTIVLAFGFPGGPHTGDHPAAKALSGSLARPALAGRDVRLVLPIGNHLQDRCHARLPAGCGEPITWRLAPDDHSPNTVEICCQGATWPGIALVTPGGVALTPNQLVAGLNRLDLPGVGPVGAVACISAVNGMRRLRLSLGPTAGDVAGAAPVPFGDWQLTLSSDAPVDLWILRDEHNRVWDRGHPRRGSVFLSRDYRERDELGRWLLGDGCPPSRVRRNGTASVLTTTGPATAVRADEKFDGIRRQAWYSGLPYDGGSAVAELVDDGGLLRGQPALGNGGPRLFRLSGTSAAAAMMARRP